VPEVTSCADGLAAAAATAHPLVMSATSTTMTIGPLRQLVAPLSLAAYLAWGAVWLSLGEAAGWLSRAAMLLFLFGFVVEHLLDDKRGPTAFYPVAVLMSLSALLVVWLHPFTAAPVLMVLLACVLAARLDNLPLMASLAAVNLPFAWLLLQAGADDGRIWISIAAYASFQLFGALVMRYARRSEVMAEQLREVNADLLATRSLLAAHARDQERLRLSRELHDVAGHGLTALKLNLAALARDPRQPDPQRVALCSGLADELLQNLRGVVAQLRRESGIDLRAAIERLAAPFPRPALHLEIAGDVEVDDIERAEAILRTVQEALTNAARHSNAAHLWAVLQRDGDRLRLELRDDGRGDGRLQPGSGLSGMAERLRAAGGDLGIEHGDGQGLRLHAWLPAGSTS
jgi:signal transduction histidine kinase